MPRARVGEIELYYLLEGPRDRPAVVLINGFSAPLEMWAPAVPALVPDYRVLLYDLRGHGRSDLPLGGYDLATQGGAWQATLPSRAVPPHHPRLGEIRAPALLILGGADMPVIRVNTEEWVRALPNARLEVIPDAGHVPNWEFPELFNRVLAEFLRVTEPNLPSSATDTEPSAPRSASSS